MALTGQAKTDYQREYMRRRRAGQSAKPEKPAAPSVQELAQAKARIAELETALADERTRVKMLKAGLQNARRQNRPEPKAGKPPLPPDEERDRVIKGLKTRVRNLTFELHATRDLNTKLALQTGAMNFQTMSAIAKALHPDQQPSEVQRAEACKLFTAWKADNGAAQRKAR